MSYRGVKRVLGETRLELKCLALFAVCLLTLIGGSFWWYGSRTEGIVISKARNTGRDSVHAAILQEHWKAFDEEKFRELDASIGRNSQTQTYSYSFISPFPTVAKWQPRDEYDASVLEQFPTTIPLEANTTDKSHSNSDLQEAEISPLERLLPDEKGEYLYQYYQPVYSTARTCTDCHDQSAKMISLGLQATPMREGDLIAVTKIEMPDATQKALNENRAIFLATAVFTVFLAMCAAYAIVRYVIVKPLKHLRDISDEIARGNMEARAEIHTADEFEELGMAFNKMVRHLVSTQEEIKHANAALDVKVDELAQTNMRLYEMNRLKSDFLATMSHELRTPLNSIIGFSEVLDSIKSLDDKQRRYVQNIQKSGRVLLDMINDILDLAKIESGKMEIRLSDFRIDNVVQAQCDFFRPQTERKNIDLEIDVEPGLSELFQDQAKVQQILSNLLSNAIKFTPEGGRITVRARHDPESGDLLLIVSDTGVGIAEEDQVVIFEKFRQGTAVMAQGDAITREHSGTGLGLSIVKELCKLLGGEVTLESQIGRGSTFTVRLPFTCAGQPQLDASVKDNLEEMLRPQRHEMQRTLERVVTAAPGAEQ
ncbi:MAG TPA: HAMP domain-containing sensor histidine kinase [Pirellulales bacterium]|nr:HAMP domain-containing sensor histidine kinase [Pirellulales bacterium]